MCLKKITLSNCHILTCLTVMIYFVFCILFCFFGYLFLSVICFYFLSLTVERHSAIHNLFSGPDNILIQFQLILPTVPNMFIFIALSFSFLCLESSVVLTLCPQYQLTKGSFLLGLALVGFWVYLKSIVLLFLHLTVGLTNSTLHNQNKASLVLGFVHYTKQC